MGDENQTVAQSAPYKSSYKRVMGGTYFYCGSIIGKKNVFVSNQYLDLLSQAFKTIELKRDIKNLAFVIMPNYFYWMFRLNAKQDNPVDIYKELKKDVTLEILKLLKQEAQSEDFPALDLFKNNPKVTRSPSRLILWHFKEMAKKFKGDAKYKIWAQHTTLLNIEDDQMLCKKLQSILSAPVLERWQLVGEPKDYPYLYVAAEVDDKADKIASQLTIPVVLPFKQSAKATA